MFNSIYSILELAAQLSQLAAHYVIPAVISEIVPVVVVVIMKRMKYLGADQPPCWPFHTCRYHEHTMTARGQSSTTITQSAIGVTMGTIPTYKFTAWLHHSEVDVATA